MREKAQKGGTHLYPYAHVLVAPPEQLRRKRHRVAQQSTRRLSLRVRHAQRAVALREEEGTKHARGLRDAYPRQLRHDGTAVEVDPVIERLFAGAMRMRVVLVVLDQPRRRRRRRRW